MKNAFKLFREAFFIEPWQSVALRLEQDKADLFHFFELHF